MRILQAIGILVALVAGVFLIGGQFLPGHVEISRSEELCHSPERTFEALSHPSEIAEWALFTREADLPVSHSDQSGPGGWVRWSGDEGETIEWKIHDSSPVRSVDYRINLNDQIVVRANGRTEELNDGHTRLRMTLILEPGSISGRWGMMLMHWIPGDDDFQSLLVEEIEGLRSYLVDQAGECEAGSTSSP